MAWSLVAHTQFTGTINATGTSSPINTTGADLIVVILSAQNSVVTVVDNYGNTLTACSSASGTYSLAQILYNQGGIVGASHTFTVNPGQNAGPILTIMAFSGSATSPLDVQSGANAGAGVTSIQPGSITPSENGALIIAGLCAIDGTAPPYSINDGFTAPDAGTAWGLRASEGGYGGYLVQTAAAAIDPTITWTGSSTQTNSAVIAAFKPAAAPALTPRVTIFIGM